MDVPNVLCRDAHLLGSRVPEKVDVVARSIGIEDSLVMPSEGSFVHLRVARQINFLFEAALLPENRDRATNLHVADHLAIGNNQDLLFLAEIGDIALIIDATRIITSARTLPHPSRNQSQLRVHAANLPTCLLEVALNEWRKPANINILPDEVAIERQVPEVFLVASDQLERVRALRLDPVDATLP